MRYNPNNGSPLFSCYSSGQQPLALYVNSAGGTTTYYTTVLGGGVSPAAATMQTRGVETRDGAVVSGVVFIDGKESATLSEYSGLGPDNEVYLAPGQAVAFSIAFSTLPQSIQLGMKTVTGSGTAAANVSFGSSEMLASISTATEMYYDITDIATITLDVASGGYMTQDSLVITNTGDTVLSLTYLKWTSADSNAARFATTFMTEESVNAALKKVNELLGNYSIVDPTTPPTPPTPPDDGTPEDPYLDESLSFAMHSLNLQSYIGANFIVNSEALQGFDSYYMVASIDGCREEVITDAISKNGISAYEVRVSAPELTRDITATLYAEKDGVIYHGSTSTYNVRESVMSMLNSSTDEKLSRLLVDMLNYAAQAQLQFNKWTDDLANSDLTQEQQLMGTQSAPVLAATETQTSNGTNKAIFAYRALGLESAVEMQLIVYARGYSVDDLEVRISYGDVMQTAKLSVLGDFVVASCDTLAAAQMRQPISATVYSKATGKPLSATLHISIESLLTMLSQSNPDIVNAIMAYGDSAQAYFGYTVVKEGD
jgi:hypothetical protein